MRKSDEDIQAICCFMDKQHGFITLAVLMSSMCMCMYTYTEIQLCLIHSTIRQVLTWMHMYMYLKIICRSLLGVLLI